MPQTRGQQIDKKLSKYEEIVGDLLRFYDDDLREMVSGSPDNDNLKAEVQVAALLTMSYATRAVIAIDGLYKMGYDPREVLEARLAVNAKKDMSNRNGIEYYREKERLLKQKQGQS